MGRKTDVNAGQDPEQPPVLDSYGRLSKVPETGELEKVETQWADNRKVIERLGGVLGEELSDGMSAWRKGAKRPGWERLLERVKSGESQGIVVWHTDRLFRQPRDLEALIDLADKGFTVASAHGARDLSDPDDRFILRIEVAHAARSSDDTSRRIKRRFATFREQGRPSTGGARPFGFPGLEPLPRGADGKPIPLEEGEERQQVPDHIVEAEREAIRENAKQLIAGVSLGARTRAWNEAGIRTVAGREWTPEMMRKTMMRPALGGHIVYEGKVVGKIPGKPILDKRTYDRLQALFAGRKRGRVAGEVGQRYVGSGILRCGNDGCGIKLTGHAKGPGVYEDGSPRSAYCCYTDRRGCGKVQIDRYKTDKELRLFTIARLSDPRHASTLTAVRSRVSERLAWLNAEIKTISDLQKGLAAKLGRRQITEEAFDEGNRPLAEDLAKYTEERDGLDAKTPIGTAGVADPDQLAAEWDNADVSHRRAMLLQAIGRDRLVVRPRQAKGRPRFDRDRIRLLESK
ncbi:recombinase family protein [Fodinicola acaciae]|uniref:recombinase family protein n=1 Tax=Fodinicola acaciae TaxID=2681555 RepID=UPI0013D7516D|nr:recombinase family protein [Fodinicola acaciae]